MTTIHYLTTWRALNVHGQEVGQQHGCNCGFRSNRPGRVTRHIKRAKRQEAKMFRKVRGLK